MPFFEKHLRGSRSGMLLMLALLALLCVPLAQAQPSTSAGFSIDRWTTDDGLPSHILNAIVQTPDGYLWMASDGGLVRFDGHEFMVYTEHDTPDLSENRLWTLHVGRGDTLWIGSNGYIFSYIDGRFTRHTSAPVQSLNFLAQDADGRLWAEVGGIIEDRENSTLAYLENGRLVAASALQGKHVDIVGQDSTGALWVESRVPGDTVATLGRIEGERFEPVVERVAGGMRVPSHGSVVAFVRRGRDTIALFDTEGRRLDSYIVHPEATPLVIDRRGHLWASFAWDHPVFPHHVLAYAPGEAEPIAQFGLAALPSVDLSLMEDREGNLWVSPTIQGLIRIIEHPFQVIPAESPEALTVFNLPYNTDPTLILDDLVLYQTTANGQRQRLAEGVHRAYRDPDGRLWFVRLVEGKNGDQEAFLHLIIQGTEQRLGLTLEVAGIIYPDPSQPRVVWHHLGDKLLRLSIDQAGQPLTTRYRLPGTIRRLFRDRSSTMWIATDHGLVRWQGRDSTTFTVANGLPINRVRSIHQDPDDVIWIGTYGGGITRYKDGRFETVGEHDGLAEDVVSMILEDTAGYFWMAGNRGVHRVRRSDLNAFLDGEVDRVYEMLYDGRAGLPNPETTGGYAFQTADGRMWFETYGGAVSVDPVQALALEVHPPSVHIEAVTAEDGSIYTAGEVALSAQQRRFEIEYTGISLRHPEAVRYRYYLDGFDADWIEAGASRRATYTNVPAGDYTFRVQAISAGGLWSETDATLALTVAPFFYETLWFFLLIVVSVFGLGTAAYKYRVRAYKQQQAALSRLVAERTTEIAAREAQLERQNVKLQSLDEAKSRFFANISHEFRTPLTLIIGPLEDFLDSLHSTLDPEDAEGIVQALRNSRRLLRLVNQILDVAKLESGQMMLHAQQADLVVLLHSLVLAFSPLAERKQIIFQVDLPTDPVLLYFDPDLLEKAFTNLLSNAFKFTPEGGTVRLTAKQGAVAGLSDSVMVVIKDSGPGIPAVELPHVFERFYQGDESQLQPGTGIGLSLARELVELHSGQIELESEEGFGSTVTVTLLRGRDHLEKSQIVETGPGEELGFETIQQPWLVEESTRSTQVSASVARSTQEDMTTVLVVDDHPAIRAYVRRHLEPTYRVVEAMDGITGLEAARRWLPDLIISDVMMPKMDGYAFCRALKADPELDYIPVILLTAKASSEDKVEGLEEGADDYLTKPFDVKELGARVSNLVATRQRLRERFRYSKVALHASEIEIASSDETFLEQVQATVEAEMSDEDFGVGPLAEKVGVSRGHLHRRLRELLGQTPTEVIRSLRLERAAQLLTGRAGSVSEVAYGVGFKSVSHFSQCFREQYGVSPSEYISRSASDSG